MKVYIAAPYPLREEAISIMAWLESQGHEVTSRWLKAPYEMNHEEAQKDLEDVAKATLLLAVHPEGWHDRGTGGRHIEFGYALALGIKIVLVGKRTNIFHHLKQVRVIENVGEL